MDVECVAVATIYLMAVYNHYVNMLQQKVVKKKWRKKRGWCLSIHCNRTRKAYTMSEMKEIVVYLLEKRAFDLIRGRAMWVDYAESGQTRRTWQSLKETFLKRILPDIHNPYYKLTPDEIASFRAGMDVMKKNSNKLVVEPVPAMITRANGVDDIRISSAVTNGNGEATGEPQDIAPKPGTSRESVDTVILDRSRRSSEEGHREHSCDEGLREPNSDERPQELISDEGPREHSDKKLQTPTSEKCTREPTFDEGLQESITQRKSIKDCFVYSEPLTPMMHELGAEWDSDSTPNMSESERVTTSADTQLPNNQEAMSSNTKRQETLTDTHTCSKTESMKSKRHSLSPETQEVPKKKQKKEEVAESCASETLDPLEEQLSLLLEGSASPVLSATPNVNKGDKSNNNEPVVQKDDVAVLQSIVSPVTVEEEVGEITRTNPCLQSVNLFAESQNTQSQNRKLDVKSQRRDIETCRRGSEPQERVREARARDSEPRAQKGESAAKAIHMRDVIELRSTSESSQSSEVEPIPERSRARSNAVSRVMSTGVRGGTRRGKARRAGGARPHHIPSVSSRSDWSGITTDRSGEQDSASPHSRARSQAHCCTAAGTRHRSGGGGSGRQSLRVAQQEGALVALVGHCVYPVVATRNGREYYVRYEPTEDAQHSGQNLAGEELVLGAPLLTATDRSGSHGAGAVRPLTPTANSGKVKEGIEEQHDALFWKQKFLSAEKRAAELARQMEVRQQIDNRAVAEGHETREESDTQLLQAAGAESNQPVGSDVRANDDNNNKRKANVELKLSHNDNMLLTLTGDWENIHQILGQMNLPWLQESGKAPVTVTKDPTPGALKDTGAREQPKPGVQGNIDNLTPSEQEVRESVEQKETAIFRVIQELDERTDQQPPPPPPNRSKRRLKRGTVVPASLLRRRRGNRGAVRGQPARRTGEDADSEHEIILNQDTQSEVSTFDAVDAVVAEEEGEEPRYKLPRGTSSKYRLKRRAQNSSDDSPGYRETDTTPEHPRHRRRSLSAPRRRAPRAFHLHGTSSSVRSVVGQLCVRSPSSDAVPLQLLPGLEPPSDDRTFPPSPELSIVQQITLNSSANSNEINIQQPGNTEPMELDSLVDPTFSEITTSEVKNNCPDQSLACPGNETLVSGTLRRGLRDMRLEAPATAPRWRPSSTPNKKGKPHKSQPPAIGPILEEHMECCSKNIRKSSPPAFCTEVPHVIISAPPGHPPSKSTRPRKPKAHTLKVKITRPKRRARSAATLELPTRVPSSSVSVGNQTSCEGIHLIHNHSESCLDAEDCLRPSSSANPSLLLLEDSTVTLVCVSDASSTSSPDTALPCPATEPLALTPAQDFYNCDAQDATTFTITKSDSLLTEDLTPTESPGAGWCVPSEEEEHPDITPAPPLMT